MAWWFFLYLPLQASYKVIQQEMLLMGQKQQQIRVALADTTLLRNSIEQLKNSYRLYASKMSDHTMVQQTIAFLAQEAHHKQLALHNCRLGNIRNKDWCTVQEIPIEVTGSFENILLFFEGLKKNVPLIACKKYELQKNELECFTTKAVIAVRILDKNKIPFN